MIGWLMNVEQSVEWQLAGYIETVAENSFGATDADVLVLPTLC
jgi:hypothetical protein